MAAVRKSQAKKIRFELTRSAIGGIAVIVFCLFLWMFLLGVWAGQSLLLPAYEKKALVVEEKGKVQEPPSIRAEKKSVKKTE
jgi:uncharacterized membrane protein YqiK